MFVLAHLPEVNFMFLKEPQLQYIMTASIASVVITEARRET